MSDCSSGSLSDESIWALLLGCVGSSLAFEAFDFDFPKKNYIYEQNKYRNQNDVLTIKYKEVKKKKKKLCEIQWKNVRM